MAEQQVPRQLHPLTIQHAMTVKEYTARIFHQDDYLGEVSWVVKRDAQVKIWDVGHFQPTIDAVVTVTIRNFSLAHPAVSHWLILGNCLTGYRPVRLDGLALGHEMYSDLDQAIKAVGDYETGLLMSDLS